MTGRTIKTRIYAGYTIEQKVSCKYRFTITKEVISKYQRNLLKSLTGG